MNSDTVIKNYEEHGALLRGHFLLSSGLHSDAYLQSECIMQDPANAKKVVSGLVDMLKDLDFTTIVSPAIGGIRFGYELASQMNKRTLFTERVDGIMTFRRGFTLKKGEKVLVAEDVVTTGKSTKECIKAVEEAGGIVTGIASIIDRSSGTAGFTVPFYPLVAVDVKSYNVEECPMCKEGIPCVKPEAVFLQNETAMEIITAVKKLIKAELKLWVAVSGTKRLFVTKVNNVYDTSFTILPPTDNGKNLIVTKKTELEFMFTIENGKYFFTTKPIGIIKENITLLAIELPASIQRNEMRAFYRVEMLRRIPVKLINVANGLNDSNYKENDVVTMTCTDLSGGGMKLISPVFLDKDDVLEIDLSGLVDDIEKVCAKVIRYIGVEEEGHAVGIMFTSLTESVRDKIIRCVFQRQHDKERLTDNFRRKNVF